MGYIDRIERKSADGGGAPELPAEIKKWQKDIDSALYDLSKAVESKSEDTKKNLTDFITKYNDHAEKYAEEKRAYDKRIADAEKKSAGAEKRVKDLEVAVATKGAGGKDDDPYAAEEVKAFYGWMTARPETKQLADNRAIIERKAAEAMERKDSLLRTDDMTRGGYLVPPVTDGRVREKVVELSPTRRFATGTPMGSKTMSVPIEKAIPDSFFEGETESSQEGNLQFGEETVTAWRQTAKIRLTYDQLFMSPFDMESRIATAVGKGFGKKESWMLINGSGNKQPQGWTKHPDASGHTITSKASGNVTFNDIAELIGSMKTGYNPVLLFNRLTFAQLIQIVDGYGRPLWQPVAGDKPATIWDQPYSSQFIDMNSLSYVDSTHNGTSNTIPIAYADLEMGYEIFDVQGMSVIRDDVTLADKSIIVYNFRRWLTAKTIMPEAIKLLKVQ